jgi:chemotaxis signal transduction protein
VPVGAVVPVNPGGSPRLLMFGGRRYLVQTFAAAGYQGYMGPPGWQGQVMVPVEVAFLEGGDRVLSALDPELAEGLLSHAATFSPPLHKIIEAAETIQRVVWNGQVMAAGRDGNVLHLKSMLEQIGETGKRSNELFSQSISNLYATVLGASLRGTESMSHLLVDLLDRNLYERSNDCRWWALTPALRSTLAAARPTDGMLGRISAILAYINSLYTVYTRIFVYDTSGCIVASTSLAHPGKDAAVVGSRVDRDTLEAVMCLGSEQAYHVTPFAPTPLYDGLPTYVYHAAIRHPDRPETIVGGIGLVFDAGPEFLAMLQGGLNGKAATVAFFVDRQGRIIASSDPAHRVGERLELDDAVRSLGNGRSLSNVTVHDGCYASMGCTMSNGYREFKVSDGYRDDVIAVVLESFGEVRGRKALGERGRLTLERDAGEGGARQFATFWVDGSLFAIPAAQVQEALPAAAIVPVALGQFVGRVGMLEIEQEGAASRFIWVFDLGYMIRGEASAVGPGCQVVVARHGEQRIGLLVDALHGAPEFGEAHIMPTPFARDVGGTLVPQVIKGNAGNVLIQVLDVGYLLRTLKAGELPCLPDLLEPEAEAA